MSDYSVTGYNPNKVVDTLYTNQSNRVVATDTIPQTTRTNYVPNVSLDTPPDTFELSAESKIKKNKEKGMSTGLKWLLGIGGTVAAVYGCVVGHRALTKPSLEKVAKNFSEIFRKEISAEESKNLIKQYQEVFKINDKDEFCKKLYEQIKKDYGYEKLDIPLVFEKFEAREDGKIAVAHWNHFNGNVAINTEFLDSLPRNLKFKDKEEIMQAITHELQHTKQGEYAFRTNSTEYLDLTMSDQRAPEYLLWLFENHRNKVANSLIQSNKNITKENVDAIIDKHIKKLKDGTYKSDNDVMETIASIIEDRRKPANKIFGGFDKFSKDSENYQQGLKYLDAQKNYSNVDMNIYDNSILEKEAFGTADKLQDLIKHLKSIWSL